MATWVRVAVFLPRVLPVRERYPLHSGGKRHRSRARGAAAHTNRLPCGVSSSHPLIRRRATRGLQAVEHPQRGGWQHSRTNPHPLKAVGTPKPISTKRPLQQLPPGCPPGPVRAARRPRQHIGYPTLALRIRDAKWTRHHLLPPGSPRRQHPMLLHSGTLPGSCAEAGSAQRAAVPRHPQGCACPPPG